MSWFPRLLPRKRVEPGLRADLPPEAVPVTRVADIALEAWLARVDGVPHVARRGYWAFYLPIPGAKILYARGGLLRCMSPKAPGEADFAAADWTRTRYSAAEWRAAYATPVFRRAAENYVAAARLAAAGLGPQVRGCIVVRRLSIEGEDAGATAGILVDDLSRYPRRRRVSEAEMRAAGVLPDRHRTALTSTIRGYVSDLNAVIGVMPEGAEAETAALAARLEGALRR